MNSEQGPGGRTQGPAGAGEQVYQGLRAQILGLDPATAGLQQGSVDRVVWGALMETGYPRGTATLVALADGTTSLYLSGGGGIIGGGSHEAVATPPRPLNRTSASVGTASGRSTTLRTASSPN